MLLDAMRASSSGPSEAMPAKKAPLSLWQRRAGANIQAAPLKLTIEKVADAWPTASTSTRVEGEYRVTGPLGQGSTSSVQHAIRISDGQEVALKTIRSEDPEMLKCAKEEFDLLKQMSHPNIVRVLDMIVLPGRALLVLEYVNGNDVLQTVALTPRKHVAEPEAQPLCVSLVRAVGYLHERRIVHRDIKPENVLISNDVSDLKLIDFNTAHRLRTGLGLTPTGTRLYAAPEVLLGDPPDELSDVWGIGICMHLLLSGRLPQDRERWQDRERPEPIHVAAVRAVALRGCRWRRVTEPCKAVLRDCLAIERLERSTPTMLLESEWLATRGVSRPFEKHRSRFRSLPDVSASAEASPVWIETMTPRTSLHRRCSLSNLAGEESQAILDKQQKGSSTPAASVKEGAADPDTMTKTQSGDMTRQSQWSATASNFDEGCWQHLPTEEELSPGEEYRPSWQS